ncbi:MAG: hypothetical protein NTW38_00600 [Candidatus Aminicenantes bacterium]|nr:hypothetical protein [Candidatus Aminicenantes bacterium]
MKKSIRNKISKHWGLNDFIITNLAYIVYYSLRTYIHSIRDNCHIVQPHHLGRSKRSKVLFILGAGYSLKSLTDDNWREIANYDVAGTTSTCLLPVRQNYYFLEASREKSILNSWYKPIYREAQLKHSDGRIREMIWKNPSVSLMRKIYDMSSFSAPLFSDILTNDESTLRSVIRWTLRFGMEKYIFLQKRASIFCLAWLGVALLYEKIVYCGVDLNDSRYFYDDPNIAAKYGIENIFKKPDTPHKTGMAKFGMPIDIALRTLAMECRHVEFYTANPYSKLAEFLPLWKFNR